MFVESNQNKSYKFCTLTIILQGLKGVVAEYCRLILPPSTALPPSVLLSGRTTSGPLGESDQRLVQGMREISMVLLEMVDSEQESDPQGSSL